MAEVQKFIFNNNYSTSPENIQRIQEERTNNARALLKKEIETATEEAFKKGLQQGEQIALQKLETELQSHMDIISAKISELDSHKKELFKIFEEQSILTVRHLVKQMFFKANEIFPEKIIQQSLENALKNIPFSTKIIIKVPSECKKYLEDIDLKTRLENKGTTEYCVVEDHTLSNGECEVQWDKSGILSSKKESLTKVMSTIDTFLNNDDLQFSENFEPVANSTETEQKPDESNQTADSETASAEQE